MQVELTPAELPDEPLEEADTLDSVCDADTTQLDDDVQTSLQELVPVHATTVKVRLANAVCTVMR